MSVGSMPVLDLAEIVRLQSASRRTPRMVGAVFLGTMLVTIAVGSWMGLRRWQQDQTHQQASANRGALPSIVRLTVDDRSQIIADGQEAEVRNAAIPFSGSTLPMGAFHLMAPPAEATSALKCLTQAVYYEAANEPLAGRRAVAQVVLNRVRHPAYPKSVCGVVYQGADRPTGCQFSFTCDGSLLRAPIPARWREARQVAREALDGHVEAEVGTATHYHADYVLPRWALEMDKIAQLGRHLFYRFEGTWGRRTFFAGAYDPREFIPVLDVRRLRARLSANQADGEPVDSFARGLTVAPQLADRHAENDVGGRIDMTKAWRPSIPDPTGAASHYNAIVTGQPTSGTVAPSLEASQ